MLSQLGEDAKLLAGGQSLIPLMKLRLAQPSDLVDLNFISGLDTIDNSGQEIVLGALARHQDVADSEACAQVPILTDCAAGIADFQVRNRGTVAGSLAEADPSGDWTPVLLTLGAQLHCLGPQGSRMVALEDFIEDAYATVLQPAEVIRRVRIPIPPQGSQGAYIAFKRSAQVYATASAAVQLRMEEPVCREARIALGCVGLAAMRATQAEDLLRGKEATTENLAAAAEAASQEAEPVSDVKGSAAYKKALIRALVGRAAERALRRARGEQVAGGHEYV